MIRHALKLVWSRKRGSMLLIGEIFIAFLVLFTVIAMSVIYGQRYFQPLGFDYQNIYCVGMNEANWTQEWDQEMHNNLVSMVRELRTLPEVEAVSISQPLPFGMAWWTSSLEYNKKEIEINATRLSLEGQDLYKLELVDGRWFSEDDLTLEWEPIIVNQAAAVELFGTESPVGKRLDGDDDKRIVGVVREFRHRGQFSKPSPSVIYFTPLEVKTDESIRQLAVRVAPGTPASMEQTLTSVVQHHMGAEVTVTINSLDNVRKNGLKSVLVGIVIAALIGGFLLIMVVLGLIGVFWQSVTRRTEEIGLRRALGSPRTSVYKQIITEIILLTTIGMALGILLILQIPLVGMFPILSWGNVIPSLLVSMLIMVGLAVLSGMYPAWMASRIQPAAALHYE